jgi:type 1 fimbria pilin
MKLKITAVVAALGILGVAGILAQTPKQTVSIKGYVLDSACAFTKDLKKPISKGCAESCAAAGSPLVILSADGTVYWPISDTTPAVGQNAKVLPFAGQQVNVTGKVYDRGGSHAIVIDKINAATETK